MRTLALALILTFVACSAQSENEETAAIDAPSQRRGFCEALRQENSNANCGVVYGCLTWTWLSLRKSWGNKPYDSTYDDALYNGVAECIINVYSAPGVISHKTAEELENLEGLGKQLEDNAREGADKALRCDAEVAETYPWCVALEQIDWAIDYFRSLRSEIERKLR